MLTMIKLHDYAHYSKGVEKLEDLLKADKATENEKMIFNFFISSQQKVLDKLNTLPNSSAYMYWCLSDDAQEISIFAKSLSKNHRSHNGDIDYVIRICAEELAYLLSLKCAQFYTED